MKEWAEVVSQLMERIPVILLILGAAFFVLGISGGITYDNWLPIPSVGGQVASCVLGVALFIAAFYAARSSRSEPRAATYGVKITHPLERDNVDVVDVRGSIKKRLPAGYSLMAFRIYPNSNRAIYPMSEATLSGRNWTAPACDIGGQKGDDRIIGIYLVGPSGKALLRYFKEAEAVHGRAVSLIGNAIQDLKLGDLKFLPLITHPTEDMIECAQVFVKRR